MTELGPHEAVALLRRARAAEAGLRARIEGQAWMMWGFILAGMTLTYGLAGAVLTEGGAPWPAWASFLFVPWTVAGIFATWATFRGAELHLGAQMWSRAAWWHPVVWGVFLTAAWALAAALDHPINEMVYSTLAYGTLLTLLGATNVLRYTATGRKVALGAGLVVLATGVAAAMLSVGYAAATVTGSAAIGTALVAGGALQSLRG